MARRTLTHRPAATREALRDSLSREGVYALGRPSAVYLRWLHDADYVQRLSQDERAWLSRFQDEFYRSATFKPQLAIHNEDQQRENQRAFKANQRDALSRTSEQRLSYGCEGRLFDDTQQQQPNWGDAEDELIESLDLKRALEK